MKCPRKKSKDFNKISLKYPNYGTFCDKIHIFGTILELHTFIEYWDKFEVTLGRF